MEEPGPWGRKEWDTTEQLHFTFTLHLLSEISEFLSAIWCSYP